MYELALFEFQNYNRTSSITLSDLHVCIFVKEICWNILMKRNFLLSLLPVSWQFHAAPARKESRLILRDGFS